MSFKDSISASYGLAGIKSLGRELRTSDNFKQAFVSVGVGAWESIWDFDSPGYDPSTGGFNDGRAWRKIQGTFTRYAYTGDPDDPANRISATHTISMEWSIPLGGPVWTSVYSPSKDYFETVFYAPYIDPPMDGGRPPSSETVITYPNNVQYTAWAKRRGSPDDDRSFLLEETEITVSGEIPNAADAPITGAIGTEAILKAWLDTKLDWSTLASEWTRQLDFGQIQGPGYGSRITDLGATLDSINPFIADTPGIFLNAEQGPATAQFLCWNSGGSGLMPPALWADNALRFDYAGPVDGPLQPLVNWSMFILRTWIDIAVPYCEVDFAQVAVPDCTDPAGTPISSTVTNCYPNVEGNVVEEPPSGLRIALIYDQNDFPCCTP